MSNYSSPSAAPSSPYGSAQPAQPTMSQPSFSSPAPAPTPAATESNQYLPYILELHAEHPRSVPNIQVALMVAEKAKSADRSKQYQEALDLYTEALERFILVFNSMSYAFEMEHHCLLTSRF